MTATVVKAPLMKGTKTRSPGPVLSRLATIPDKAVADKYINRDIGGVNDFDLFDLALKKGWNVLLEGHTGSGKTMASRAYAAARSMHFYSTPNNVGIDPSQLFGKFIPDETGKSVGVWQDGPVTDMVRHGGVLLLNEINFLPPRVATAIFSLLDGRREIALLDHKGEVIRAHPDLLIVADMNPGYAGTSDLNQALRNRFEVQVQWDYDTNVEKSLIKSEQLRIFASKMRKSLKDQVITTPTSTNMMIEFEELVFSTSLKFAMANLVQHFAEDDRQAVQDVLRTMEANFVQSYDNLKDKKEKTPNVGNNPVKPVKRQDGEDWDFVDEEVMDWLSKKGDA